MAHFFPLTVTVSVSLWVAAQLARTFSASSEGVPGSAVYTLMRSPGSAGRSSFKAQVQIPDDRVVEPFASGTVILHVVPGPPSAELLASG